MHVRLSVALIALVSASLAGCAQLEDFTVRAPAWESGYTWTYNSVTEFREGGEQFGDDGEAYEETLHVLRHADVVDGAPLYIVEMFQGEVDDGWSQLLGISSVDLSSHWIQDQVIYDCDGPPACVDGLALEGAGEGWPFPTLDFPLTDGKTWTEKVEAFVELKATVMGSAATVTPAGTFDAVHVRYTAHIAETETYEGQEESFDIALTWDLFYSEEVRAVVKDALSGIGTITEIDHEAGSQMRHDIDVTTKRELLSYSLEAKPQMTMDELWTYFDGDRFVHRFIDIDGGPIPGAGTGMAEIEFSADTYGLDNGVLEWTVTDAAGTRIDEGKGSYFFAEVPYGGSYRVDARALRNGSVLAEASTTFALEEEVTKTVDCGTVLLGSGTGCPAIDIPIKPGAYRLRVDADPSGLLPPAGYVQIIAPDGTVYDDDKADLAPGDNGTWQARYVLEQGVEVSVELTWTVAYTTMPRYDH